MTNLVVTALKLSDISESFVNISLLICGVQEVSNNPFGRLDNITILKIIQVSKKLLFIFLVGCVNFEQSCF